MNLPYYELYRVRADRYVLRQRIVAHARQQGVVRYAESSDDPGQLPNFDKIKGVLAQLK